MVIAREIIPMRIEDEMRLSYTRYAMSVIVGRALPDVRDGLKPVHRRILYAMFDQNMTPDRRREKCASTVGEVLKKYHPHGDQSVYDALVRMAQDFSLRYPLVDGQGNFGSVDGDTAAAYRYTEARMAPLAVELLRDIESETVDFIPNFSESTTEPSVFPAVYPNMLVNGSAGIAVGMATNIPPHNLGEICDAVTCLVDNPNATVDDLMKHVPGPDFPTGGLLLGKKGIRSAYETGRGSVIMQARATIEPADSGRNSILITELPYQVNKATLIENIAAMVRDKKIEGIADLNDYSDRNGMRVVVELKREANPNVVLNLLYKHTALRSSFGIINLSVVDGQPRVLTLKEVLEYFIQHRENVIRRRSAFHLRKAEARAHILEGLRAILASIDDVIALIRSSASREDARNKLMNEGVPSYDDKGKARGEKVTLSELQANAVLDMRLGQLTQLDRMKIDDEYADLLKEIERLRGILESVAKVRQIIRADMARIKKEYGDPRRTQLIEKEAQDIRIEDLIADEEVIVTITRDGYIKKLPIDTYRTQGRGGKGIIGLTKKEEDAVEHLFICSTHNILLVFTNRGRIYQLKAYEVPSAARTSRGTPIINMLSGLEKGEVMTAVLNISDFSEGRYLFMVTKNGTVKKTPLADYATRRTGGIIAINLDGKDELRFVFQTDGNKEILMATRSGLSIRFNEANVRSMGRNATGVTGMKFKNKGDYIVGAAVAELTDHVLTVSEDGMGKRSSVEDYRLQTRGGTGVITLKVTEKTGELVSLQIVKPNEELLIITQKGVIIRQKTDTIRETGRVAQGVKLIRLNEGDKVAAVAKILLEPEGDDLDGATPVEAITDDVGE
ncbi:MAG TPA: DNA gyrase subunit A [Abditibacteriaceae bacterium]|jgi:DNA gyrase subunit A